MAPSTPIGSVRKAEDQKQQELQVVAKVVRQEYSRYQEAMRILAHC